MSSYKHGEGTSGKFSPEYISWRNMRQRCLDPNDAHWPRYGGRGIIFDPAWAEYIVFLRDMGRKPTPKHTLDRINLDGNYCRANCRWATMVEQNRNHSKMKLSAVIAQEIRVVYAKGKISQRELARLYGCSQQHISVVVRGAQWA